MNVMPHIEVPCLSLEQEVQHLFRRRSRETGNKSRRLGKFLNAPGWPNPSLERTATSRLRRLASPIFFHYVKLGPNVREQDMITDVYLPLN